MDEYSFIKKKNEEEEKRKKKGFFAIIADRMKHGRLLFLLVAFILTLIGLTTSTYAWFTSNYTVSVQQIDVNVSSGSGIQISTNAETWKSMITQADITTGYTGAINQIPAAADQINPVSTVKEVYVNATDGTGNAGSGPSAGLHMYKGTIVNDESTGVSYLNTESQKDGTDINYIAFDLFLKLDFRESGNKQIYLTSNTGITTATGGPNTFIEYAGRMGFVIQGSTASTTDPADMRALKGTTGSTVLIYEPNYDVHTNNGLVNARDNYNITGYQTSGNANAVPYYGVKAAFAYDSTVPNSGVVLSSTDSSKFAQVTPDLKTTIGNSQNFAFTQLPVGVTKIRVYMWVEGQDIDCENTASGGKISFNLGFSLDAPGSPSPSA
jgi:hypothetical protein